MIDYIALIIFVVFAIGFIIYAIGPKTIWSIIKILASGQKIGFAKKLPDGSIEIKDPDNKGQKLVCKPTDDPTIYKQVEEKD